MNGQTPHDLKFACDLCRAKFASEEAKTEHDRAHHSGEKGYRRRKDRPGGNRELENQHLRPGRAYLTLPVSRADPIRMSVRARLDTGKLAAWYFPCTAF